MMPEEKARTTVAQWDIGRLDSEPWWGPVEVLSPAEQIRKLELYPRLVEMLREREWESHKGCDEWERKHNPDCELWLLLKEVSDETS